MGIEEIERARAVVPIATVQNKYNVADRAHEPVLAHCEKHGIGFMPCIPITLAALQIYLIIGAFMGAARAPEAVWHGVIVAWLVACMLTIGWLAMRV